MKKFKGHINLSRRITIFGDNAMHYAIEIYTKKFGYICIHPSIRNWPWYFYCSPNATPWAATYAIGPGLRSEDRRLAPIRKAHFGHNFNATVHFKELMAINGRSVDDSEN